MAEKVLEDVLNDVLSVDFLVEWLTYQSKDDDVDKFNDQYKCSRVEFTSYFLCFLREQCSMFLQSSWSVDTPSKNSVLQKGKSEGSKKTGPPSEADQKSNCSTEKSLDDAKSDKWIMSSEGKLDVNSFESFPSLTGGRTKSSDKHIGSSCKSTPKEGSASKDRARNFRRVQLFPEKGDEKFNSRDSDHTNDFLGVSELQNNAVVSTPKCSGKASSADLSRYFNHAIQLDRSPEPFSGRKREFRGDSRPVLGDFISSDIKLSEMKKDKKNKIGKRINPTRVKSQPARFEGSSSFEVSGSSIGDGPSIPDERKMLKMECANVLEQLEGKSPTENRSKDAIPVRVFSTPSKTVTPNAESATFVNELKLLARIYSCILDESYCQNIMIEYCFIIGLLVSHNQAARDAEDKTKNVQKEDSRRYMDSVHNTIYFAVETLWLQRNVLTLLNLPALKLLSENKEVEKFNSDFKDFLTKVYTERLVLNASTRLTSEVKRTRQGNLANVSFECENDNKDTFISNMSFHSFIKQRDLFYNILAVWEENHVNSDWVFSTSLEVKIRTLFNINSDPTNLMHLARLFRSQLVMSCCGEYQSDDKSDEEILQLLPSVDPNKIVRLRARLKSTPKRQGPCPLPDFMGYQEFFRDFILTANHTIFHYYLKNSLCDEILRLNETEFSSDLEDDDLCLDQQTQSKYLQQINILCVLAKFLGFVEFLPYRSDKQWTDRVLSDHCAVRQNLLPLFDLEGCLKAALAGHKLTVTLPWIVSFLSMIDFCSSRLNIYQNIWKMLINVYTQLKTCKNLMNAFYLKLTLGWIFQLPIFPIDLFYGFLEDLDKNSPMELCIEFTVGLDSYNFIDETILYSVCPYLNEINAILSENTGCSAKHIRPVTAQVKEKSSVPDARQIELRLEESFLHNQSSSTRRTIDFVTERVSSIAVKYLISNVIPKIKEESLKEIDDLIMGKKDSTQDLDRISERCFRSLISTCEIESWHLCSIRSEKALSALLSTDLEGAASETCIQIVTRQSAEKVMRWIQAHITVAIVKKEFEAVQKKKTRKLSRTHSNPEDSEYLSIVNEAYEAHREIQSEITNIAPESLGTSSHIFIYFRDMICHVYEGGKLSWKDINYVVQVEVKNLYRGSGFKPAMEKTLFLLVVDFLVIICACSAVDFRKDNFTKFFEFLKQFAEVRIPGNSLEKIICPRNLALFFRRAKNPKEAWRNLGNLFLYLMEEELLTKDQVEAQLVSLLRQNWNKKEATLFTTMINHMLTNYVKKNGCDKFSLLLEYLMETLTENDESKFD